MYERTSTVNIGGRMRNDLIRGTGPRPLPLCHRETRGGHPSKFAISEKSGNSSILTFRMDFHLLDRFVFIIIDAGEARGLECLRQTTACSKSCAAADEKSDRQ